MSNKFIELFTFELFTFEVILFILLFFPKKNILQSCAFLILHQQLDSFIQFGNNIPLFDE